MRSWSRCWKAFRRHRTPAARPSVEPCRPRISRHGGSMKAGKVILALLLAGGAFAAYWYFPDPLGDQVAAARKAAGEKPAAAGAGEEQAAPAPAPASAQ